MIYFKIYPISKSNCKGFHFKIPSNTIWGVVVPMQKLLSKNKRLLRYALCAMPSAAAGMGRAGGLGGWTWGHPCARRGDELCPGGQHPLPGLIQRRDIGSSACRRHFCRVLLFCFFITNLATFISEKLAGEPWLALGLRLI